MLRVKNNNIYLARGETCTLKFEFWTKEGTPYILPVNALQSNLADYADVYSDSKSTGIVYELSQSIPAYKLGKVNAIDFRNGISAYNFKKMILKFHFDTATPFNISVHGLSNTITGTGTDNYEVEVDISAFSTSSILLTSLDINLPNNDGGSYLYEVQLIYTGGTVARLAAYKNGTLGTDIQKATEFPTCAFTVRSGSYDSIVIQKYLNLKAPPMYAGDSDYALGGYNKFTTDELFETNSTSVSDNQVQQDIEKGIYRVYHSVDASGNDIYQHALILVNGYKVVPYVFNVVILIRFSDTELLEAKEYIYDVINYFGTTKGPQVFGSDFTSFPYSKVSIKKELISPHKFVLEDTNNA